jgi:hypothetical protein
MAKKRNYNCKDVDMLMTSKTVAGSFKANISELSAVRTDWTENYATGLETRIDNTIENDLGVDVKKDLRNASAALAAIQVPARRDLSFFKTQIDDDFKNDPSTKKEILKTLGFDKHLRDAQNGNQESLILLLYAFKNNMTDTLRQQIVAKGLSTALIDKIIGYADNFKNANASQESQKSSSKEITKDMADTLNGIYDEIIGICKKASNYYQYEPLRKEQFTFAKVLANLGAASKTTKSDNSSGGGATGSSDDTK